MENTNIHLSQINNDQIIKVIKKHQNDIVMELQGNIKDTNSSPIENHVLQMGSLVEAIKEGNLNRLVETISKNNLKGSLNKYMYDAEGHTMIHWAAQCGNIDILKYLHIHEKLDLNKPSIEKDSEKKGLYPIHWASIRGKIDVIHYLILNKVNIDCVDEIDHRTPLLLAAQNGHSLLVHYLIKNGANINILDSNGDSAIHWAAYKGLTEIVIILHYLGLNANCPDMFGQSPLHLAAMEGHLNTVQYFVEELDADIFLNDEKGRNPYQLAIIKKQINVIHYLSQEMKNKNKWNKLLFVCPQDKISFYFTLINITFIPILNYYIIFGIFKAPFLSFNIWHILVFFFTIISFFKCYRKSPGNVRSSKLYCQLYEDVLHHIEKTGQIPDKYNKINNLKHNRPFCHTCRIQRPIRSKHCRICKTCIEEFDHHCPFIANCVGKYNYGIFLAFIIFTIINIGCMIKVLWNFLVIISSQLFILKIFYYLGLLYYFVLFIMVANLVVFHLYLTATNLTTNEMINGVRYSYFYNAEGTFYNRFNKGIFKNVIEKLFPPTFQETNKDSNFSDNDKLLV